MPSGQKHRQFHRPTLQKGFVHGEELLIDVHAPATSAGPTAPRRLADDMGIIAQDAFNNIDGTRPINELQPVRIPVEDALQMVDPSLVVGLSIEGKRRQGIDALVHLGNFRPRHEAANDDVAVFLHSADHARYIRRSVGFQGWVGDRWRSRCARGGGDDGDDDGFGGDGGAHGGSW